jgi:hypothetical protein
LPARLAYAMADDSLQGVWGGTSTRERREWRARPRHVREMSAGHEETAGHNEQQRTSKSPGQKVLGQVSETPLPLPAQLAV